MNDTPIAIGKYSAWNNTVYEMRDPQGNIIRDMIAFVKDKKLRPRKVSESEVHFFVKESEEEIQDFMKQTIGG